MGCNGLKSSGSHPQCLWIWPALEKGLPRYIQVQLKSYWNRVGPTSVVPRRQEILDPVQREDSHGPMGSVMIQEAQECQDHLNLGRAKMGSSLGPRRTMWLCWHLFLFVKITIYWLKRKPKTILSFLDLKIITHFI